MKKLIIVLFCSSVLLVGCATEPGPTHRCDFEKQETTPASRFEINRTDGTVFDTKTKLTWKICVEGQSYIGKNCTGNQTSFTWENAMQSFGDTGNNWRLPNVDELSSIVEARCRHPAVNSVIFPAVPSLYFWTSSPNGGDTAFALGVFFGDGDSGSNYKTFNSRVRLVRGEQWGDLLKQESRKKEEQESRKKEEMVFQQQREAEQKKHEAEQAAKYAAIQAENNAYVTCNDKASCDKLFSLAQIYIKSNASQKIQVATDTIIETYNPTENGNIGMSATKIPGKGSSATIRLTVMCKVDDTGYFDKYCGLKKLDIYNGFRSFVNKMLGE